MNNEEKFRNSLIGLLNEPHYAYDASNWDKASQHLDELDKKRKRRFLFVLFAGIGLGVFVSGYLLLAPKTSVTEIQNTKGASESRPATVEKQTEKNVFSEPSSTSTSLNPSKKKESKAPEKTGGPAKTPEPAQPASAIVSGPVKQITKISFLKSKIIDPLKSSISLTVHAQKNEGGNSKNEDKIATDVTHPIDPKEQDETKTSGNNDLSIQNGAPSISTKTSEPLTEANPVPKPATSVTITPNEPVMADTTIMIKTDSVPVPAKTPSLALPDTSAKSAGQPSLQSTPKINFCYAEAGGYFNFGWRNKDRREGVSINPYLGLSYFFHLTDKTGFSAGAYYTSVSNLKQTKVIRVSRIVFGEEAEITSITPTTLNYISIPLKLHYLLDATQSITFGYTAGYLLDVQSNVEKHIERLDRTENNTNYKTGGYVEGFKTFNSQLSLGYSRMLYSNFRINGELFFGLTDLRNNTFFGINATERSSGIKISLTYDLIKK